MRYETEYRVVYDDPDGLDEPTKVLYPAPEWMYIAMTEGVPSIANFWEMEDEETACQEVRGLTPPTFRHKDEHMRKQEVNISGPLTEQQAIEYLCMKDLPRKCWSQQHNRPMFKIVKASQIPRDRTFRNAWKMIED